MRSVEARRRAEQKATAHREGILRKKRRHARSLSRLLVATAGKDFSKRSPPSLYDSWLKCRESARKKEETRGKRRERERAAAEKKEARAVYG